MDSALAWAMYTKELTDLTEDEKLQTISFRKEILLKFNVHNMKEGYNPDIKHVRFNLEHVSYIHKVTINIYLLTHIYLYPLHIESYLPNHSLNNHSLNNSLKPVN